MDTKEKNYRDAYQAQLNKFVEQHTDLLFLVSGHEKKTKGNSTIHYGRVGDIEYINARLAEILDFIK